MHPCKLWFYDVFHRQLINDILTTHNGWWPPLWQCKSPTIANRLPICRLSAVGSNPQYILIDWDNCRTKSDVLKNKHDILSLNFTLLYDHVKHFDNHDNKA